MNKKILAALTLITASSTQAAFDEGNAILYAYDSADDDTYFVDLGVTGQDLLNTASFEITDAGLAAFLASNAGAQWSIIATVNSVAIGCPPASCKPQDDGVISTSTSGAPTSTTGTTNYQQQQIMNDWLADVQAASGGASSFGVAGTDPVSADAARNGGFFNDSLIAVGADSNVFFSQADTSPGALNSDPVVVSALLGYPSGGTLASLGVLGDIRYNSFICAGEWSPSCYPPAPEVPIPATAWLFGSSLIGLLLVRRTS